jgi:RNA polymerase sigma-B factor
MNLVKFLARKYSDRGEPLEDLVQVGSVGLINAIDRFDPDRGIRFATFATPTITGEIRRYFRDRGWAVKVPRRLQEISLAAARALESLPQKLERSPTIAEIAHEIGASEEETLEAMELGHFYELASLDGELTGEDDQSRSSLSEYVGRSDAELERFGLRSSLEQALTLLPAREGEIIRLRFLQGLSQTEVAKRLGISQMHVSRLQHRALARLRKLVQERE